MPSIATNRANFNAAKEAGSIVPIETVEIPKPVPVATYPAAPNPILRSPLPAIQVQQPDQQRQWQTGAVGQSRLIPVAPVSNPHVGAQAASQVITVIQTSSPGSGSASGSGGSSGGGGGSTNTLVLETNNIKNNSQSVLNLIAGTNISLSADSQGGVTVAATGTAGASIASFTNKVLSGNVALTNGVDTTLTDFSTTITFPGSGGPWRVDCRYKIYHTHVSAVTINAWVFDSSAQFCGSQTGLDSDSSLNRENTGSAFSNATYANGAVVPFTVHIQANNTNVTVQQNAAVAGPGSFFEIVVFSSV
jgi:hypothetical protein